MNCNEANKIPITEILSSVYNCRPESQSGNSLRYFSPVRNERTPSFFVTPGINRWIDYGANKKGGSIDLVCELSNVDVSSAINILQKMRPSNIIVKFDPKMKKSSMRIEKVRDITSRALISYLEKRSISFSIAYRYLKEVTYSVNGKCYYALGFKNDLGGWELRNDVKAPNCPKGYKGCISPKTITTIPGTKHDTLNLYEGFFNFLSCIEFFKTSPQYDTIVLNSLVNLHKVDLNKYERINLWLDNDEPGINAANKVIADHGNAFNFSQMYYPDFNDFNDFLLAERRINSKNHE